MSAQVDSVAADCREHALSAAYYADAAAVERIEIVENAPMARDTYRLRLKSPQLAARITPGQFLMLRLPGRDNPLLARPFALYDTWLDAATQPDGGDNPLGIDIGYLVVGRMTRLLSQLKPGDELEFWGPLGNGFPVSPSLADVGEGFGKHLIMVAGGIGQTPFLALGREALRGRRYGMPHREVAASERVTLCYGVRTAEFAAGVEDFRAAGIDVRLSSNDGSLGQPGLVTELLNQTLDESNEADCQIVCCGPEPMMEAVAKIAAARRVPCQVSLETPMACGIGICFSCVAKVMQPDGEWDYKRTCVEGPVFDAERIVW